VGFAPVANDDAGRDGRVVFGSRGVVGIVQAMVPLKQLKIRIKKHLKETRRWYMSSFRSFAPADLRHVLGSLGLAPGDSVLVHSSFDAFEGFQGKPSDVLTVLQQMVGASGVLMMPTMTFSGTAVEYARTNPVVDLARAPSRMGLLTEMFRRSPGVVRSAHPTHPVAIWGADATTIAAGHHLAATPCGTGTPFDGLRQRQGKIVLLGAGIGVLTYYHLLEELLEPDLPLAPFTDEVFTMHCRTRDGLELETRCRLFEPAVSKRRNLHKMVPGLKKAGAWREARVGGLSVVVLAAADVEREVRSMSERGIYCYD
jgi:aminoglycoside 3-N-acetyltransferase